MHKVARHSSSGSAASTQGLWVSDRLRSERGHRCNRVVLISGQRARCQVCVCGSPEGASRRGEKHVLHDETGETNCGGYNNCRVETDCGGYSGDAGGHSYDVRGWIRDSAARGSPPVQKQREHEVGGQKVVNRLDASHLNR